MRHLLLKSLAGSGLLLATTATAQDRERTVIVEKEYHQAARGDDWWRGHMFQRVREDLDHVRAVTEPFSADAYRVDKVDQQLNELQRRYEEKHYDQSDLDEVVDALQRVAKDNHLTSRDREMLDDDLSRLRAFREHHEGYR